MHNVKMEIKGNELNIKIKIDEPGISSKTGKSMVIASTNGNIPIPEHPEIMLGLNCYKRIYRGE